MTRRWMRSLAIVATIAVAGLVGCTTTRTSSPGIERIEHIVVIYAENRSFDNLYGGFPGANGLANVSAAFATSVPRPARCVVGPRWWWQQASCWARC